MHSNGIYTPVNLSHLRHDDTEGQCSYRCTHFYISPVSRQLSHPGCITRGTSCIGGREDPTSCLDTQRHKNIPCRCRYSNPEHPARNLVITAVYSTWIERLRPGVVHFNLGRGKDLVEPFFGAPIWLRDTNRKNFTIIYSMGRDSSVGIATRYGLEGPGIETRWGRDFPHPSKSAMGPTQPTIQWLAGLSRG